MDYSGNQTLLPFFLDRKLNTWNLYKLTYMEIYLMKSEIKKPILNEKGAVKIRKLDLRSSSSLGPSLAKERSVEAKCTTRNDPGCEAEYTCNF
jgi:hypothetical protein